MRRIHHPRAQAGTRAERRRAPRWRGLALAGLLLTLAPTSALAVSGDDTIVLVAGVPGLNATGGDGGRATLAPVNAPSNAAADLAGNVYIASLPSAAVRKVDANGIISRFAGIYGSPGFNGDLFSATESQLNQPSAVVADSAGNVYISDAGNDRVRRVDRFGIISTVASGVAGPTGLAVDRTGNVYVADASGNRLLRITPGGVVSPIAGTGTAGFNGDGQPAGSAQLSNPVGVAVDAAGRIYIADAGNNRIRRIDLDGTIHTIAGTGPPGFAGDGGRAVDAVILPTGVAVDGAGNVYFSEVGGPPLFVAADSHRVRKVDRSGIITTIAGNGTAGLGGNGGPARFATLSSPVHLSVEPSGSLLIGDQGSGTIRRIVNLPPSASFAASANGLTVAFDASASSGTNDGIAEYIWDFGDGSTGTGVRPAHSYPRGGSFTATLTAVDDSGAVAVAARQVAVVAPPPPPPPPDLALSGAAFRGSWSASRVRGRLTVTGNAPRAARLQIQVFGPGRASRARLAQTFTARAGAFRRTLKLSPTLLPGSYRVRVRELGTGQKLTTRERRATLAAPREGVVSRAWVSTSFFGRPRPLIFAGPRAIAANFTFAALPARGRPITVTWFWSKRRARIQHKRTARQPSVGNFLRNRTGPIPAGTYRAELRVGGKLVSTARIRIR